MLHLRGDTAADTPILRRMSAVSELLRRRDFAVLFAGQTLSFLGSALVPVALAFAVLDLTGSPTALGLVLLGQVLPVLVLVSAGGVLGDRMRRERLLFITSLVACAAQAFAAALLLTDTARVWHLFVLQLVLGGAWALTGPAQFGLVGDVAPRDRLQEANALISLSRSVAGIAGPVLAGLLVALASPGWALAVDALTYAGAAVAFFTIGPTPWPRPAERRRIIGDLVEGWREFRSRDWLWSGVVYLAFLHLFVIAPFLVLGPIVAKESLGGAGAWATILTAGAVGSVVAGLLALRLKPRRPLFASFALYAVMVPQAVFLAAKAPLALIAIAALLAEGVLSYGSPVWNSVLQEKIPRELFSRVHAYDIIGSFALLPLGFALAGPVAEAIGVDTVLWFSAAWLLLSTTAIICLPSIRRLRREPLGAVAAVESGSAAS